ncbi:hypothetical protein CASFOL_031641 [Castilleja foliolosa]|uniref:Uncharacterized protein n=1 Tax=Castilleja foliolosa TaxID=1961234 RepID=A0ABD3C596_9LAMI
MKNLEYLSSDNPMSNYVSNHVNESQYKKSSTNSDDSFVLDINASLRLITLQRNQSSKINQGKVSMIETSPSTATLHGGSSRNTIEHPTGIVGMGSISIDPQVHYHHHITINNVSSTTIAESKRGVKKLDFKHYTRNWAIDPRKILLFFATM